MDNPKWLQLIKNLQNIENSPTMQEIQRVANNLSAVGNALLTYSEKCDALANSWATAYERLSNTQAMVNLSKIVEVLGEQVYLYNIYHSDEISLEEKEETNEVNEIIISEILLPDTEKKIHTEESPIITLSPVNDQVLKYLSENPEELYKLTDTDFEIVMAEIYAKLGYDVIRTQQTRDGGKDIIIRKPEILGDFVYYVECKKHSPNRPVGIGIIRNFVGTVTTDRVNGGILATTSFFTKPARDFILENKWNCQIKMHDYNTIQELLNKAINMKV